MQEFPERVETMTLETAPTIVGTLIEKNPESILGNIATDQILQGLDGMTTRAVYNVKELLTDAGKVGEYLIPVYLSSIKASPYVRNAIVVPLSERDIQPEVGAIIRNNNMLCIAALEGWSSYSTFMKKRRKTLEIFAAKLDCAMEDFDERKTAEFVFAHEMGHIEDIEQNSDFDERRRNEMASLPVPNLSPSKLIEFITVYGERRYENMYMKDKNYNYQGITVHSAQELIDFQQTAYRELPTEDTADQFAVKILKKLTDNRSEKIA